MKPEAVRLYKWSGRLDSIADNYALPVDMLRPGIPIHGFAYEPEDCSFLHVEPDGRVMKRGRDGARRQLKLSDAFDMRLFCSSWELRWRKDGAGARLAVLSEQKLEGGGFSFGNVTDATIEPMVARNGRYLLWGEPAKSLPMKEEGWMRLTTARLGALWVPHEAAGRISLLTREYFIQPNGAYGNWVFHTERLTGFSEAATRAGH